MVFMKMPPNFRHNGLGNQLIGNYFVHQSELWMMPSQPKIKCTEEKPQVKGSIRGKVILKMYLKILQYSPKKKHLCMTGAYLGTS